MSANLTEGLVNHLKQGSVSIKEIDNGKCTLKYNGNMYSREVCDLLFTDYDEYEAIQDQILKVYNSKAEANEARTKVNKLTAECKKRGYSNILMDVFTSNRTGKACFIVKFYLGTEMVTELDEHGNEFIVENDILSENCEINFYLENPNLTRVIKQITGIVIAKEDIEVGKFYHEDIEKERWFKDGVKLDEPYIELVDEYSHTELYVTSKLGKDLVITLNEDNLPFEELQFEDIENNQTVTYVREDEEDTY